MFECSKGKERDEYDVRIVYCDSLHVIFILFGSFTSYCLIYVLVSSLEDTCQALTEVLQDCGKSLESNLVGINKIVEYEQEGDHVFNEHVHDMVDTICEDIDGNNGN